VEQTESSISTYSGRFFDILKPEEYDFDIEEIATALSNLCRYTGHVNRYYSVAEHSVLVSRLVPSRLALCGLLHDASEAFLGDVSSPLKRLLPEYKAIEERVEEAIAAQFDIPFPYPDEVHDADKRMYWQERQDVADIGVKDKLWHQDLRAARKVEARGLAPHMARRMFLAEYKKITKTKENDIDRTDPELDRREHRELDRRRMSS
jgi:uncharacterized protein